MTSIEWLIGRLKYRFLNNDTEESIFEQAKEMHKQEIIDAQSYAISNADMTNNKGYFDCDKYYQEKFVSKGSDECQTFEKMYDTTSATLCANCGKEKFLHKT